jgi:hypothetical protein
MANRQIVLAATVLLRDLPGCPVAIALFKPGWPYLRNGI